MFRVNFFNDYSDDYDLSRIEKNITKVINLISKKESLETDAISIIWVTDDYLKQMHIDYLNDPTLTDVITFPDDDVSELYISVDRAKAMHSEHNFSLEKELAYYAIHGALHLSGYDDHEEEDVKRMRKAEEIYLKQLNN